MSTKPVVVVVVPSPLLFIDWSRLRRLLTLLFNEETDESMNSESYVGSHIQLPVLFVDERDDEAVVSVELPVLLA